MKKYYTGMIDSLNGKVLKILFSDFSLFNESKYISFDLRHESPLKNQIERMNEWDLTGGPGQYVVFSLSEDSSTINEISLINYKKEFVLYHWKEFTPKELSTIQYSTDIVSNKIAEYLKTDQGIELVMQLCINHFQKFSIDAFIDSYTVLYNYETVYRYKHDAEERSYYLIKADYKFDKLPVKLNIHRVSLYCVSYLSDLTPNKTVSIEIHGGPSFENFTASTIYPTETKETKILQERNIKLIRETYDPNRHLLTIYNQFAKLLVEEIKRDYLDNFLFDKEISYKEITESFSVYFDKFSNHRIGTHQSTKLYYENLNYQVLR